MRNKLIDNAADRKELHPFTDAVYVFCRKGRSSVKLLYWGGSDSGSFSTGLRRENGTVDITYRQMEWLLDGLDIEQKHYVGEVK